MKMARKHVALLTTSCLLQVLLGWLFGIAVIEGLSASPPSRRQWLEQTTWKAAGCVFGIGSTAAAASASNELPLVLRDYTKLAPLGPSQSTESPTDKSRNLPLTELARRLQEDLTVGHSGQGGYFISGDLDDSLFRDDCVFVDPTNRVQSLPQYRKALGILFDPQQSYVQLLTSPLGVDEEQRTLQATLRSRGVLQLPWRPYITSYESTIVYTVDDEGLICEQSQTWSKPATTALRESFTPGFHRPAPQSTIPQTAQEPEPVTKLFDMVNGRRPYEYSERERKEMDRFIDQIIAMTTSKSTFRSEWLPGKWMLVYLQPGPTGAGIDRRIPFFPEFDFNDNFQIFQRNSVENIGQVLGPWLSVRVQGDLKQDNPHDRSVPKRFVAQINSGEICWDQQKYQGNRVCLDLPISGEGLFDSVYLGERLRIGQNINGGRARVVQVKLE